MNCIVSENYGNKDLKDVKASPIKKFYANTNIFITGGTGFLGVLLLEKLLVTCPNISKIFLLVRKKKGKNVEERMEKFFDDEVFFRVKEKCPKFKEKVVVIEGDCEFADLGINNQDREMLAKEVDIVFHMAATVRFDEPLKKASFINVRGVRDVIKLAKQMPNLKSFVHVSTAYSNCIHTHIKEEIYPPPLNYKYLLNVTESLPEDILTSITPLLVGNYPNTYTYTKQIGEDVIRQESGGLPIGIHRPSIVTSTYKEPLKGWINNIYGPTGYIAAAGVGLIRTAELKVEFNSNLVPADLVVNSVIASAWDVAERFVEDDGSNKIPVYTFANHGPRMTWGDYTWGCEENGAKYCPLKSIWYMFYIPCSSHFSYVILEFLLHTTPAFIVDSIRFCMGKPPMLLNVYKKIRKMINVLKFFMEREWSFDSDNLDRLKIKMSDEDRKTFYCDLKDFNWDEYLDYHALGIRTYLVKDPLETLPEGQKRYRKLYWIHVATTTILFGLLMWILRCLFSFIYRLMI